MATLLGTKSVASIGPINVVQPTSLLAKAEGLKDTARSLDRIRARYLSDQVTKKSKENQTLLENKLLETDERWVDEFYYWREQGEEGLEKFDKFMATHSEAIVSGLPESIQDDAEIALTTMRLSQTGSLREEQYQAGIKRAAAEAATFYDLTVESADRYSTELAFNVDGNLDLYEQSMHEYMDQMISQNLDNGEWAETEARDFQVDVAKIINGKVNSILSEQKERAEAAATETHNGRKNRMLDTISSSIEAGASNEEILILVRDFENFISGDPFNQYETSQGAEDALKPLLYDVQAQILAAKLLELRENGDFTGEENLLARFGQGDPTLTDGDVLMLADWTGADEIQGIIGTTQTIVNYRSVTSQNNQIDIDGDALEQDLTEQANNNPLAMGMNHDFNQYVFASTPVGDANARSRVNTLYENNSNLAIIAGNALMGQTLAFSALSTEDQSKAIKYYGAYRNWSPEGFLENPNLINEAFKFAEQTSVMPPSLESFLNTAGVTFGDTDQITGATINAIPVALRVAKRIADTPNLSNVSLGPFAEFYTDIIEDTNGLNVSDAYITQLFASRLERHNQTLPVHIQSALANYNELSFEEVNQELNNSYHDSGEARLLVNQFSSWFAGTLYDNTSMEVSTGELSLTEVERVFETLPEAYYLPVYKASTQGMLGMVGDAVDLTLANVSEAFDMAMFWVDIKSSAIFLEDIPDIQPGTSAGVIFDTAVRDAIQNGVFEQAAFNQGLRVLRDNGYGLSMFATESIIPADSFELDDPTVMPRQEALTRWPFESNVPNFDLALQEVLVAGTKWARSGRVPNVENLDLGDLLDQGRLEFEPVEGFNPDQPRYNIYYYPTDARMGNQKQQLFLGLEDPTWAYSGEYEAMSAREAYETIKNEWGIESGFVASILGPVLQAVDTSAEGSQIWPLGSQTTEGLSTLFGGGPDTELPTTKNEALEAAVNDLSEDGPEVPIGGQ
jgi:hypothetical protein